MKQNMKQKNNGETFKKIIVAVIIILFIVGIIYLIRHYSVSSSDSQANEEITEIIRYTLGEYLGEYGISEITVNTLEKEIAATGSNIITSLSKEDQQAIIDSVTGILKPELYQKINSNIENVRQQILTELETKLEQAITETVENKLSETVVLTEEQKQLLIDNTAVIVETKIMEKLREEAEKNADAITALEHKIQINLTKIESTLNSYETKLQSMEKSINELKNVTNQINVDNAGNVANMENQISILQNGYDSFRKEYIAHVANALTVSNIVSDLSVEPQSDEGVLSAQTGYAFYMEFKAFQQKMEKELIQMGIDINKNIMEQINNINANIVSIESDLYKFQADTADNFEELRNTLATKTELAEAQTSLSQSLELTNQNLSNLSVLTTERLKETKDTLDQAILDMGDKVGQDLIEARNALQEAIDNNVTDIAALRTALNNALEAINNNKTMVDNELQAINNNISNIKNALDQAISDMGDKAGQDLIEARDALQAAINNNMTDITALQSALNSALTVINNNKTTVDSQLQTINNNVSNINNSISGVKSEVDNLKGSQVAFEWSSDENGSTLKIITP